MKNFRHLLLLPVIFVCSIAYGQNMFMKISGVPGETQDQARRDWISLTGYKLGIGSTSTAAGSSRAAIGKTNFNDLIITKKIDKTSPVLMQKCALGENIPEVEIEITAADGKSFYRVVLSDVRISGVETASQCSPKCETTEEVSLNYSKITWEHKDNKGSPVKAGYDVKLNKRI